MKKFLLGIFIFSFTKTIFSQCTVTGSIPRDTIVCGDGILLSAYGRGQGIAILSENFNNGTYGPGWSATQQAMFNNPCGANTIDGSTYIWMGNSSPVPRILTTTSFNLSSCTNAGVTICFDMKYATQGNAAPCEGPDLPAEGVYVQYSIDNGATWNTMQYYDPNGGYDPQLTTWNNYCLQVPLIALTANTKFRWYQDNDSGADYDHWGIDNVVIYCNDPTYNIVWQHDNYSLGPTGGTDPNAVAPHTTTSYTVVMSNGTTTCRDTVTIFVRNPTLVVNAGNDTSVCNGQCAQLHATAKVMVSPAKTPTYTDNEIATVSGTPGFPGFPPFIPATPGVADLSMSIGVTGLNQTTIQTGSITSVCISSLAMIAFGGVEIFDIWLICPSGDSILLVPDSTIAGANLTNTCFVPGGANITSSSSPYTGSFGPNQPFTNLNGCTPNGQWTLHLHAVYFGFTLPTGFFNSWSISFNDPEISYTGNFNWSPTTNMTNFNTLTPTVCPPPNTFTITVSDTAGCVTQSDAVNVNTQTCCGLSATIARTQPSCGASNGSINVTPMPAGSYSFIWSDAVTTQNRINLPAGNYCVTITDNNTPTCTFDTCIVLNSNSSLSVSFTNPVNPTCAGNDGSVTVNLAGGTAPYNVTIDTGGAPIVLPPIPFPISQAIPGLPAGTVNVSVTDAGGCVATATATLTAPANCCTFVVSAIVTQPACAQTNGSVVLTASNGSGNYSYNWSGGLGATNSVSSIGAGNYLVTITDNAYANCFIDTTFALTNPNAPVIDSVVTKIETCPGTDNGSATVFASGGTGALSYSWGGGQTTANITNLTAGNYPFTVSDANSCQTAGTAVIQTGFCCTIQNSATVTPPTCGLNNAVITITITTVGIPPYSYSIDGVSYQASNIFNNVASGNYNAITRDANSCSDTAAVVVPTSSNNLLITIASVDISCFGANNGSATANVIGGNVPYSYIWNTTATSSSLTNLTAGNYSVSVTDQTGCTGSAATAISEPSSFSITLNAVDATCFGASNGNINAVVSGGTPGYFYLWSDNSVNQTATGLSAGSYSVTVTDNNACTVSGSANVNEPGQLSFTANAIQVRCPGEKNGAITVSAAGGTSPYNYSATQDGANFFFATNDTIMNLASGTYSVILSDNNGCTLVDDVFVPAPAPDNFIHTEDSTSCYGSAYHDGAIHIEGTTVQNMPYQFGVDGGVLGFSGDLYNLTGGNHIVTAINNWGCTTQIQVTVPEPVEGVAEIFPGDTTIQLGETIQLSSSFSPSSSGAVSYLWSPSTGLSCIDCPNPIVTIYSRSTQYVLTVTYNDLCKASANITVLVQSKPEVYIPNSFSPNGDGNNDEWMIYGKSIKTINLKIFNRWGEKIYETNNVFAGWDGTYKGVIQNPAVFVYEAEITFLDDKKESRIGSIMLLR